MLPFLVFLCVIFKIKFLEQNHKYLQLSLKIFTKWILINDICEAGVCGHTGSCGMQESGRSDGRKTYISEAETIFA